MSVKDIDAVNLLPDVSGGAVNLTRKEVQALLIIVTSSLRIGLRRFLEAKGVNGIRNRVELNVEVRILGWSRSLLALCSKQKARRKVNRARSASLIM